jgi:ubiquinone/menaquinone biosynthesis C-methylase UbiE
MLRDPQNIESKFIRDILGPNAGNVLEIGCGDGRLTAELMEVSENLLGLDPDRISIEKARHLLEGGARLILGSGEDLPLPGDAVDTVVFSLSLHHHPDPGNALAQAQRVLKTDGRILVLEPEAEAPTNQLFRIIHNEDDAYVRAIAAIDMCDMEITLEGTYETSWRFDDLDEMTRHLFSYFELEPDPGSCDLMARQLGDRRDSRPLDIVDITRYWLLQALPGDDAIQVE